MPALLQAFDVLHPSNAPAVRSMLAHLDSAFTHFLPVYTAREVSTTVWAWGHMAHVPSEETWACLRRALLRPAPTTQQHEASEKGGSHAAQGSGDDNGDPAHLRRRWRQTSHMLASATPQALSMLSWGLYQMRQQEDDLWDAIAAACCARSSLLQPRDLANILWAYASAGRHDTALFSELSGLCIQRIPDFTPQDLANTAWAFAAVGHPYKPLFDAIAGVALRLLPGFTPQGLANLVWAYGSMRISAPELFDAVAREALGRLHAFSPAQATMTAWAFARNDGQHYPQLMSAISRMVVMNLQVSQ